MGTSVLSYAITFSNGYYKLKIPNGAPGLLLDYSVPGGTKFVTHPTDILLYYFGDVTLNWQKITNLAPVSRENLLDLLAALSTSVPSIAADVNLIEVGGAPVSLGQKVMANSIPVVLASDQSSIPISGTVTANQGGAPWSVNETQIGGVGYSLGQKVMASSAPVVIASDQSSIPTSVSNFPALQNVNLTQVGSIAYSEGQKLMAASAPVVLASDQTSIPVSATQSTSPWVVSGTVTALQGGAPWSVNETQIGGASYTLGQKLMATSAPVVIASDQSTLNTAITNFPATTAVTQSTSPWVVSGTVTANQGGAPWSVNETQIGGAAYSLGQKPMATSAPVVIASDQSAIPVSGTVSSTPSIPASADIVGVSRTTTGTLVVVPTGRTFVGSVSLSCSVAVLGNSQPSISVAGAGVVPTGTIHQIIAVGLALTTVTNSNTIGNVYIFGGSAGATVTFTQGVAGTSTGQICGRYL